MYEKEFVAHYEPEYEKKDYSQIQFLKKGQGFNTHISEEKLIKLPVKLRRFWYRLDLSYLDDSPIFPDKDPISKMTETPPDLFQMMKDKNKRIKVKAMVFGELDNEQKSIKI